MIRGLKVGVDRPERGLRRPVHRPAPPVDRRVRLDTGEYVAQEQFDSLTRAQQQQLQREGVESYNRDIARRQRAQEQLSDYMRDGQLDISAAVAAGKDDALKAAGISREVIGQIRAQQKSQIEVHPGQFMTQAGWADLPAEAQERIRAAGVEAYNRDIAERNAQIERQNAETARVAGLMDAYRDGNQYRYIDALIGRAVTVDDLVSAQFVTDRESVRQEVARQTRINWALPRIERYKDSQGNYDLQGIYRDGPIPPGDIVLIFGPQEGDTPEQAQSRTAALKEAIEGASVQRQAAVREKYATAASQRAATAAQVANIVLDVTVPVYGTVRHWSEMDTAGKALSIAMDAAMIGVVFGVAGKAARAVTVATASRGARLAAAGKAVAGASVKVSRPANVTKTAWRAMSHAERVRVGGHLELGELWHTLAWPAETVGSVASLAAPIEVAKVTASGAPLIRGGKIVTETLTGASAAAYRTRAMGASVAGRAKALASPGETALSTLKAMAFGPEGAKLAESSVTTAYHTVRFPLSAFDDPAQALKARNALITASKKPGNHIQVVAGDVVVEFRRGPLMDKLGGMVSGTPMGDEFTAGLVVKHRPGQPWEEQGLFYSPTPLGRFVGETARGVKGAQPTWVIATPELAAQMGLGTKTYRGAYELETVLAVGGKVPPPVQRLYTRLGDTGMRVEILLPSRLTKSDILTLNAQGLIEQVKNIYAPAVSLSGRDWRAVRAADVEKWAAKHHVRISGDVTPEQAKRMLGTLSGDARQSWLDLASTSRPLTRAEADTLGVVVGRQSRAMQRNLARASGDVSGALLAAGRLAVQAPEVARVRVVNQTGTPRLTVDRVTPRAGESPSAFVRRVETEMAQSQVRAVERMTGERAEARAEARDVVRAEARGARAPVRPGVVRAPARAKGAAVRPGAVVPTGKEPRVFPAGSVAFAMGQLHGQPAYWVLSPPKYGAGAGAGAGPGKTFHLGVPSGVQIAPDLQSAYQTIRSLGGRVPAAITGRIGFAPYRVEQGRSIKFSPPRLSR